MCCGNVGYVYQLQKWGVCVVEMGYVLWKCGVCISCRNGGYVVGYVSVGEMGVCVVEMGGLYQLQKWGVCVVGMGGRYQLEKWGYVL